MPVILLTGTDDREVDERAASIGAHDFLVKGQFSATVLDRAIRYAIQNHAALRALHDSYRTTVHALASALELRDDQTGAHATRVTELALELTRRVAPELADDPELEYGFLLHDIGKIGVPDGILLKDGPLDDRERSRMQTHVTLGQHILSDIPFLSGVASQIAAAHHERWDGTGYPNRLRGSEIPLAARIFSIIDSYDAMTSERPYRSGQPTESALAEIRREAGKQFDPQLAETFVAMIREVEARNAAAA
jgi:response regulator RpfG family c-di-GMP phosphodiesterase